MIELFLGLDRSLFLVINSWHLSWLNSVMVFISGWLIWPPFVVLLCREAYIQFDRKSFYLFLFFIVLALVASDATSSYILKNIFERPRPCRLEELLPMIHSFGQKCGGKYGFVSSHAANSFAFTTFAIMALKTKKTWFSACWTLPCLVSYSRIYLGVHYPGDILCGALVGFLWGILLLKLFNLRNLRSEPSKIPG